jgi:hypothetical protein
LPAKHAARPFADWPEFDIRSDLLLSIILVQMVCHLPAGEAVLKVFTRIGAGSITECEQGSVITQ